MSEALEETVERYLQRRQPTWRPATVADKRYDLLAVCRYLRAHHPELHGWRQLQRDPHILGWLRHHLHLKPATRIIRIIHLRLFFEDLIRWEAGSASIASFEGMDREVSQLAQAHAGVADER